jgi:trehalose synthase
MTAINRVNSEAIEIDRFRSLLEQGQWHELEETMREYARAMRGRTLWNVNSTARGGGVVELLSSLIPYDRGCGIDERWDVIEGSPAFFNVTKRLHNLLHGADADGIEIDESERREYESTLDANARSLAKEMKRGDVALLHDPQVAGLVPALADLGVTVIWRCHIGVDEPNDAARSAWQMLIPYLAQARAIVFSRRRYAWEGLDASRVHVIAPTIDPFTVKNRDLPDADVAAILQVAGIMRTPPDSTPGATFERKASLIGEPFAPDARIVVQVSRWDRLKDPAGVLDAFAHTIAPATDGVLVLAGPEVTSVDDDPEQPEILNAVERCRDTLPPGVRSRVLIAQLPMVNVEENATMVNALQRRADVVVQKSLAEGFGLTVAEAMWKARPIVASRVGGIEDQIEHGRSGLLIDDPRDLACFGDAVSSLLRDHARAEQLGRGARQRAISQFLAPRHLVEQARLVMSALG